MTAVRSNFLSSTGAGGQYIQGVMLLKQEFLGPTTRDLGIIGPNSQVSTYDLFTVWHHLAMFTFTPPSQTDRNAAHRGPVFLPWHRFMLLLLELQLQRVLNDERFGLPYWDWAADGELSAPQQRESEVWNPQNMGGDGNPVATGPFAHNAADPATWRVRIQANANGQLVSTDRGLRRAFGQNVGTLPSKSQATNVMNQPTYDAAPWNTTSAGFRNRLEGWLPASEAPALHNRVHVWVGGDMLPSSSPNDPIFYLNHCNVDRLWQAWLDQYGETYVPAPSEPATLQGHRLNDAMHALLSQPLMPSQTLDLADFYRYDSLTP